VVTGVFCTETPQHRAAIAVEVHWFIPFGVVATTAIRASGAHSTCAPIHQPGLARSVVNLHQWHHDIRYNATNNSYGGWLHLDYYYITIIKLA
jgi:hypothetical protein